MDDYFLKLGDEPEKIKKIWRADDGRLNVRVEWKQPEEGPRLVATTYGVEEYPPAGYKLLMDFLVGKYLKAQGLGLTALY